MHAIETNVLDSVVGQIHSSLERSGLRRHTQHPAARGQQLAISQFGSGVKNLNPRPLNPSYPKNLTASFVFSRVSTRGHHDTYAALRIPLQTHRIEAFL